MVKRGKVPKCFAGEGVGETYHWRDFDIGTEVGPKIPASIRTFPTYFAQARQRRVGYMYLAPREKKSEESYRLVSSLSVWLVVFVSSAGSFIRSTDGVARPPVPSHPSVGGLDDSA